MAVYVAKVTFSRGELTPLAQARRDIEIYQAAAKSVRNWYVLKEGGVRRRSGTKFRGTLKFNNKDTRLLPFVFSTTQAYAIEQGDLYTRFWTNGAFVAGSVKNISGATKANPCVVTAIAHGFSNGDQVFIQSVVGMTQLNNRLFTIANVAADTFELVGINSVNFSTYVSGGTASKPYEVVSPYAEANIRALQWAQSFDTLFVAHPSKTIKSKKLIRLANDSWQWQDVNFIDGPYLPINDQNNTVNPSDLPYPGTSRTFTHANTTNINGGTGFVSTDVNRHYRFQMSGRWAWGKITTVTNNKAVIVNIIDSGFADAQTGVTTWTRATAYSSVPFEPGKEMVVTPDAASLITVADVGKVGKFFMESASTWFAEIKGVGASNQVRVLLHNAFDATIGKSKSWRLGAFSDTTGYPGSVSWFQGRLFWGRTDSNTRSTYYSRTNFPEVMSPSDFDGTVLDDHGGALDLLGQADEIKWLAEAPRLQIGTGGAIRSIGASDTDQTFSPRNISQRIEVTGGVGGVNPVAVGPSTVHIGRYLNSIHDLYFDFNANTLVEPEISNVSNHLLDSTVKELVFQQFPNSMLWAVLGNGTLAATTVERYEKVIGFSRHDTLGGVIFSGCAIPASTQDDLYMLVRRTVNGSQVQYIETLDKPFQRQAKATAYFADCGGVYTGTPTNTVSGINWLEGVTVDVLADGAVVPQVVITAGVLTLPGGKLASTIAFGIPIADEVTLLPPPINTAEGSSLGRHTRVISVIADVYETLGLRFVSDRGEEDVLKFRSLLVFQNQSPPLLTGEFKTLIDGSWSSDGVISFKVGLPLPATVRALNVGLDTEP